MSASILDRLADGPVLGDGGYVFILKERGVPMEDYSPYGILSNEETVRGLYQEFFDAGAEVIQAQTFQGTRNRLEGVGAADHYEEIHRKAVEVARSVIGEDGLLASSIGSAVGSKGLAAEGLSTDDARGLYQEECELVAELGVDFLILETLYYIEDACSPNGPSGDGDDVLQAGTEIERRIGYGRVRETVEGRGRRYRGAELYAGSRVDVTDDGADSGRRGRSYRRATRRRDVYSSSVYGRRRRALDRAGGVSGGDGGLRTTRA